MNCVREEKVRAFSSPGLPLSEVLYSEEIHVWNMLRSSAMNIRWMLSRRLSFRPGMIENTAGGPVDYGIEDDRFSSSPLFVKRIYPFSLFNA
jgi:hypothetical protein